MQSGRVGEVLFFRKILNFRSRGVSNEKRVCLEIFAELNIDKSYTYYLSEEISSLHISLSLQLPLFLSLSLSLFILQKIYNRRLKVYYTTFYFFF